MSEQDWKLLWQVKMQDRLKLILWKIAAEALPLRATIFARMGATDNLDTILCPLCSNQAETALHLFQHCPVSRILWRNSAWPLDIANIPTSSPADLIKKLLNADDSLGIPPPQLQMFIINAAIIFYELWYSRNQLLHAGIPCIIKAKLVALARRYADHFHAWHQVQTLGCRLRWVPPEPDWLKVNFDVAVRCNGSFLAVSCRDYTSSLCIVYTERLQATDPLVGEVLAAVRAVELALENNWPV
ncbi:hypothetical protein CJ030_MR1G014989 [Morella rubra]|uniref:Reverse transcriptase zinc-binding domain-containing protein n=1 Tax=Morella rubra TaxID=262757 RepID=A0A6A1WNW6_9ROSI|nr:hypothetical protein CJ030_MR1G014989 [Morella rubra]